MFKNRFILIVGVLSVLLVTMALSKPFSAAPTSKALSWPSRPVIARVAAANNLSDFYQRHPDWTGAGNGQEAAIPVTSSLDLSDYYLRHPELSASSGMTIDMMRYRTLNQNLSSAAKSTDLSDYFLRHPELIVSTGAAIDTSDYFLRHPELIK